MAAKWPACGSVKDHVVEAGLAELVRDFVWCVESYKCDDVLDANETLWKAEKELNCGIRGGYASAAQKLRGGVYTFRDLPVPRDELCTFKQYNTILGENT